MLRHVDYMLLPQDQHEGTDCFRTAAIFNNTNNNLPVPNYNRTRPYTQARTQLRQAKTYGIKTLTESTLVNYQQQLSNNKQSSDSFCSRGHCEFNQQQQNNQPDKHSLEGKPNTHSKENKTLWVGKALVKSPSVTSKFQCAGASKANQKARRSPANSSTQGLAKPTKSQKVTSKFRRVCLS
jgi:hypothetical protein